MKLKKPSRREFLKQSRDAMVKAGASYGMLQVLDVMFKNAVAQAAGSTYKFKYVNLISQGAPPRWYFDQPLNPENNKDHFILGGFGTAIAKNSAGKFVPVHSHIQQSFGSQQAYLPPVWNLTSAAGNGKFNDLLKNSLMIRGINMEINSHPVNRERTVRPFSTDPSLTGLVADEASSPIPAIGHNATATGVYKSPSGSAILRIPTPSNPIPEIIAPFNSNAVDKAPSVSVDRALAAMDEYAAAENLSSTGAEEVLESTYQMFSRNLGAFDAQFKALSAKYKDICKKEFAATFVGVNDKLSEVVSDGSKWYSYAPDKNLPAGTKVKTLVDQAVAKPHAMGDTFALIEFCLVNNLTSSMSLAVDSNVMFAGLTAGSATVTIPHDQHNTGVILSIIFSNLYYRGYLGCMLELRKALTAAGIFKDTVIHNTAEFSRTPRTDGGGSDHGFLGSSCLIISGMMSSGALVGNIHKNPVGIYNATGNKGTWGIAADFYINKTNPQLSRPLYNDDVVRTLCEMLQVQDIGTKGASLVKNTNGVVTLLSTAKGAKNVA